MSKNSLSYGMVCASNQNRSMAAHKEAVEANLNCYSYGSGKFLNNI
jgi:hypothetical protein